MIEDNVLSNMALRLVSW